MDDSLSGDICRVCRCEGAPDRPLFHPCICTGSIKFIHQECLLQWLRYSKKEFCELCNYRFSFTPIYSPDMPKRIPIRLVFSGVLGTVVKAVKFWLHYTLVACAWLGAVPLTACRIYRTLFTGSVSSIFSLPVTVFSTENIISDILVGSAVVTLTLLTFIGLVWLREQILHGGGPAWLEPEAPAAQQHHQQNNQEEVGPEEADPTAAVDENNVDEAAAPAAEVPAEPPAPEILEGVGEGEEQQWNPMEWDRAAEELTWERLLGLDGTLVFLEHVGWVISLNSLFILIFAFCPYHIGHFTLSGFKMKHIVKGVSFEGLVITMAGYCMIGLSLIGFHTVTCFLGYRKVSRALGLCYVVVKVALLLVTEILVFPVVCGWWLDLCSLSLFDATLKDRLSSFNATPWASVFIHWLVGMVYVFYFASFVILLREVLRPGVLWFLRNLNDPDFNPVQEMIHLPLIRHIRRFCASLVMFGTSIFVMLYCPSRIIKSVMPSFLPYTTQSNEGSVDEISMELLLLLVFLPAIQDQNHTREWLKWMVQKWCAIAAWTLDLRSYLFGDVPIDNQDDEEVEEEEEDEVDGDQQLRQQLEQEEQEGGLGAVHQALLIRDGPIDFQPYIRTKYFGCRIAGLVTLMIGSWLFISLFTIVVPVWIGRQMFNIWVEEGQKVYELYTSATGFYICLLMIRGIAMFAGWLRQGWTALGHKMKEWALIAGKAVVAFGLLLGLIPFLFGILIDLVVLTPIRVPLHQSPLYFYLQDWFLGLMYTKITVAVTFMGPDWWLKLSIEQFYMNGIRNLRLHNVIKELVVPCVTRLGLSLAIPYVISHGLVPLVLADPLLIVNIQRRMYPFTLLTVMFVCLLVLQFRQFTKLIEHIKNDRYLVGRRLVNYNHRKKSETAAT